MKGGVRRGGPVGLRAGQEHRARQPGRAKSGSERAGALCGTDTTRHRACRCGPRGTVDGEREERGQKRACTLPSSWGRVHPNADPRKQGGGAKKRGQGKRGGGGFRSRSRNGRSPCRKEQRRGGAGKLPPRSSWASGLECPRPSGPLRFGRPAWAELPSSPFSEPGAASSRAWSPGSPQRGLRRS